MAQRILRPLSYGDMLDEMFDLYKRNFLLFAGINGVVYVPFCLILYAGLGQIMVFAMPGRTPVGWPPGATLMILAMLLFVPLSYIALTATTWATAQCYLSKKPTILESYRAVFGRTFSLLATVLVAGIIIVVGFVLCVIPGIIASIWFALMAQVFVVEGKSMWAALDRSRALSKGHWWRIFLVLVIANLIVSVGSSALRSPIMILGMASQNGKLTGATAILSGLVEGFAYMVLTPIQTIALVLLYYDIRVRKEGFDLELLAADMGEASASPEAPGTEPGPA